MLRFRTLTCRATCSTAIAVFSSNNVGNVSKGKGVTQANAAASLAARRTAPFNAGLFSSSNASRSSRFFSRSKCVSCVARNGTGGAGLNSNRVSGPNRAGTLVSVFLIVTFRFPRPPGQLSLKSEKPAIALAIAGFLKMFRFNQIFSPTMPVAQRRRAKWTCVPGRAADT
jgi:hypothetical protein